MAIDIEVISKETIKPSSPTPQYLQHYQLSYLDQIAPSHYISLILFYESNPLITHSSNTEKSNHLKSSLSESLTRFYPLAGRLVNNESIHCNDEGVPYIEEYAKSKLSDVICSRNIVDFDKLAPRAVENIYDNVVLAIKVNFFECGGIAIGVCLFHKVADASSTIMFLNSWAATMRGDDIHVHSPIFESAKKFPPRVMLHSQQEQQQGQQQEQKQELFAKEKENMVMKMFMFNNSMLEILRAKFSSDMNEECPIRATRVEALTAFLWKRYMHATKANTKGAKIYSVVHAVNLRSRMDLSKYHFGNFLLVAQAKPLIEDCDFVRKLRGAIKSIDGKDVVDNLLEGDKYLGFLGEIVGQIVKGERINLGFTSWCRMPLYEIDFGWGKPVRVSLTSFPMNNVVFLIDSSDGHGIEAWINMEEEDMAKLEVDQEFVSYVSPTIGSG